jgi:hypothetical protein
MLTSGTRLGAYEMTLRLLCPLPEERELPEIGSVESKG